MSSPVVIILATGRGERFLTSGAKPISLMRCWAGKLFLST